MIKELRSFSKNSSTAEFECVTGTVVDVSFTAAGDYSTQSRETIMGTNEGTIISSGALDATYWLEDEDGKERQHMMEFGKKAGQAMRKGHKVSVIIIKHKDHQHDCALVNHNTGIVFHQSGHSIAELTKFERSDATVLSIILAIGLSMFCFSSLGMSFTAVASMFAGILFFGYIIGRSNNEQVEDQLEKHVNELGDELLAAHEH